MSFTVTTRVAIGGLRGERRQRNPASLLSPDRDVTHQPDHHLGGPRRSLISSSATGTKRASARAIRGMTVETGPADRRLRDPVGFGQLALDAIAPQIGQGDYH